MYTINTNTRANHYKVRNKWIDGFTMSVFLTSLGGGFVGTVQIDPTALQLIGTLKRNGAETVMFNHTLRQLVILSHLTTNTYNFIKNGVQVLFTLSSAAGIDTALMGLRFDFGGPICLIGDDEFTLRYQLNDGFFGGAAAGVNNALSFIELDETESTTVEYFIPITHAYVIEAGQNTLSFALGDNVQSIVFANYDKGSATTANQIINSLSLKSKQLSKEDDYLEILTKNFSYYPTMAEAINRYQNFVIYQGHDDLDGVTLNMNLNSANVTASNNWILSRNGVSDDWLVTRGHMIEQKKDSEQLGGRYNPALIRGRE